MAQELERFLEEEKQTRTRQEAMEYYEKRMDTIDLDFVFKQFLKQVKRLEQRKQKNQAGLYFSDEDDDD